ncbi:hypothetical protein [Butyrivibrio sp. INlla14]|uniref:hypothetical protein n=1 Tax=Butyrivibrio sp. INlla14 TaxID=1520808 RepID=UPI00087699CC|nr:hypothetical protein [Butyrivibrio sp. INlla14]SCY72628.1 hypothetical protein SAMN02910371_03598 [Butyrivibrio sp. INlla14]
MKVHYRFICKVLIIASSLVILMIVITKLLTPKKLYNVEWPTTLTYTGFYEMPRDTVDVLFFGSSHGAAAFDPQVVYNLYGIKSYNLSCEQQNLLVSYYWLEEALKYQSPKVVVLDPFILFPFYRDEALNTSEICTRLAIDPMRWSHNKLNAVMDICKFDGSQSIDSYFLKTIRFHAKWKALKEHDFSYAKMENHFELKGYAPLSNYMVNANENYMPFRSVDAEGIEMVPLMQSYLDKIVDVCKERNIALLIVKTPTTNWDIDRYNEVKSYSEKNNIRYIDFNEMDTNTDSGFSYLYSMSDDEHCNLWGAETVSAYVAGMLYNDYGVTGGDGYEAWANTNDYYSHIAHDCELRRMLWEDDYWDGIRSQDYTLFVTVYRDGLESISPKSIEGLQALGIEFPMGEESKNYCAVVDGGKVMEKVSENAFTELGAIRDGIVDYKVEVDGLNSYVSTKIDNVDYSVNKKGINIVVYSNLTWKVIDSVCIDSDGRVIRN